ncbi:hypothetical protein DW322_00955 [Rhodococcus rhodnii]|nr:hypothetical protein [Rhodococcus rhodnii]TXG89072.1 hypothetical protein DW322_00955 [Rhodococcus rhodnii]
MTHDIVYRGPNGIVWDLYGPRAGRQGAEIMNHVKGLYLPPRKLVLTRSANQRGATARKVVEDERVVEMVVSTQARTGREHDDVESLWWQSWSHLETGRLEVDRGARWLDVQLLEYPDDPWTIHPEQNNYLEHDMRIVACNPAWQGGTRTTPEQTGTGVLTFKVRNPTDLTMWPVIVGDGGGIIRIQDGLTDRIVEIPHPLHEGWKVFTDPQQRTLDVTSGLPLWPDVMRGITFGSPLPAGMRRSRTLTVEVQTEATVRVELVDQWIKPWG